MKNSHILNTITYGGGDMRDP